MKKGVNRVRIIKGLNDKILQMYKEYKWSGVQVDHPDMIWPIPFHSLNTRAH